MLVGWLYKSSIVVADKQTYRRNRTSALKILVIPTVINSFDRF
jgi:hypothetical protein